MDRAFNKVIKSHVILSILSVFAIVLVMTGATYALFQVEDKNTENQVISIGTLDASLTSTSGSIVISDIYPTSMSDLGANANKYSFKIQNTGTYTLKYDVYLTDNTTAFKNANSSYSAYTALGSTYYQYIDFKMDSETTARNLKQIYNTSSGRMSLLSGYLEPGASETHTIQFWLDKGDTTPNGAPNAVIGRMIALNVNLEGTAKEEGEADTTLAALGMTAKSGNPTFTAIAPGISGYTTNIATITGNTSTRAMSSYQDRYYTYSDKYTFDPTTGYYTLVNPKIGMYSEIYEDLKNKYVVSYSGSTSTTMPSYTNLTSLYKIGSNTTSATLYYTSATRTVQYEGNINGGIYAMEDDYGTSYYFRGAITNNYVNFANKYWRIIRINGDGSIRMQYDGTSAYANGSSSAARSVASKAFQGTSYSTTNDNAFIGYMYGTKGSTTYEDTHANTNSSDMKTYLEEWYTTNIETPGYAKYVSDEIFCNDRSLSTANASYTGIGTTTTYYGAYQRLYTNKSPRLSCPQKNDAFTVNDTKNGNGALSKPIGLITADELVAAGAHPSSSTSNSKFYLYKGHNYRTMTPWYYSGNYARQAYLVSSGYLSNGYVYTSYYVAPVINISAQYARTMTGNGTTTSPFRVVG